MIYKFYTLKMLKELFEKLVGKWYQLIMIHHLEKHDYVLVDMHMDLKPDFGLRD